MTYDPVINDPAEVDFQNPPGMKPVILKSENTDLVGTLFTAGGEGKKPTVILLHGFPGNENNFDIAHSIKRFGWNVLVFHYRGTWGSKGMFTWSNSLQDVMNVIDSVRKGYFSEELKVDNKKIVLVGHSMGGFYAAYALAKGLVDYALCTALFNIGMIGEIVGSNPEYEAMALQSLNEGTRFLNTPGGRELLSEMINNSASWNLLPMLPKIMDKNFYMIGASRDMVAPIDLHYKPIINTLKKLNPEMKYGEIIESSHSFGDRRILLTRKIIQWLDSIIF